MRGDTPASGRRLALALQKRFPEHDWLAALAKAAVLPRGEVERLLQLEAPPPPALMEAAREVETLLAEPAQPGSNDHVFAATTNDTDVPMEVDREAGMTASPENKGMPSQTGSEHEMRTRPPSAKPNVEDLPLSGVPEAVLRLHRKTPE